jgi:ADP-heptose:LPS heptosyltransferase
MVATSRHVDEVLTLPDRWSIGSLIATMRVLRQRCFDIVFVPDRSPVLTLLTWLARIPQRVGLDSAGRGFAYTHPVLVPVSVIHEADLYSQLALAVGLPQPPRRLFFFPTRTGEEAAASIIARYRRGGGPWVALHPGGGQNPGMTLLRKRWLPERWAAVADELIASNNAQVMLVGGPGDHEVVASVAEAMQARPEVLVQRWDWSVLGAFLEGCDLFLGHDTGMMHLAAAVQTPTVAVFGPSDPRLYAPYGLYTSYLWRPTPFSPCFQYGVVLPNCPCAHQCMRNIEVADVLEAARRLLTLKHMQGARRCNKYQCYK